MVIQEVGRQDVVLMALIEINAEFKLILKALNRIADCLERAYPAPVIRGVQPIEPDELIRITDESLWLKEQEEQERNQARSARSS